MKKLHDSFDRGSILLATALRTINARQMNQTIAPPCQGAIRTIYNPYQNDSVTFLETCSESGGKHTLLEVIVAPGGGTPLHYHDRITESFTCLTGMLSVQLGKQIIELQAGETASVPIGRLHRFFNRTDQACTFRCSITPGSPGGEQALQIAYGLVRDGRANKGLPKNPLAIGYLFMLSESRLAGILSVMGPVMNWLGRRAISTGMAKALQTRYVTIH
jgi:quercetin dioxygenase-like cupin family protein